MGADQNAAGLACVGVLMELILSMCVSGCCLNPALLVKNLEYFSQIHSGVDQQMGTEHFLAWERT